MYPSNLGPLASMVLNPLYPVVRGPECPAVQGQAFQNPPWSAVALGIAAALAASSVVGAESG